MSSGFVRPYAYDITWFHPLCIYFYFLILHGVCIMGTMGYILVGGLIPLFMYHHLFMYFLLSLWYVFLHFFLYILLCFLCFFLDSHIPLVFLLPFCVSFIHAWMKTFGGCMHMHFIICSYICVLRCVHLIYLIISDVIGQDSKAKHVIF